MSFKHKVLITSILLMAVSLGVVGFLMIHNSYQVSMDMQLERAMEEHQMIVSAVESAVVDLLVNDSFHSMEQIGEIGGEIAGTVEGTGASFSFLDGERTELQPGIIELSGTGPEELYNRGAGRTGNADYCKSDPCQQQ